MLFGWHQLLKIRRKLVCNKSFQMTVVAIGNCCFWTELQELTYIWKLFAGLWVWGIKCNVNSGALTPRGKFKIRASSKILPVKCFFYLEDLINSTAHFKISPPSNPISSPINSNFTSRLAIPDDLWIIKKNFIIIHFLMLYLK